jgi:hypothetical protein
VIENLKAWRAGPARASWLVCTVASILGSLLILAIYANTYDDYGLTERLRAIGGFPRWAMRIIFFPIGLPFGAMASGLFERIFGRERVTGALWRLHRLVDAFRRAPRSANCLVII